MSQITNFIEKNFKHFNAATLVDAAKAYKSHIDKGGKMLVSIAGAMSTAELGISLAEMIRCDKVHAISCTGANLEEDLYNLIAHNYYKRIPNYRELTPHDEEKLLNEKYNRVTDTCIPEEEAMRVIESITKKYWLEAREKRERFFPHEYLYKALREKRFEKYYQIPPENSWLLAACEKNLPIYVPGWEDSTLGNNFAAFVLKKELDITPIKSGLEYMVSLANWYLETSKKSPIGFFQIGGGIAGDFAICVVPMLTQDVKIDVPIWAYFCQVSDSTTSYGSYSGAVPNEKITWGKLSSTTPRFIIESDATIVCPLVFAYVLGK